MKAKLNHAHPDILEAARIKEIKALSYSERLERLMAIIEVSYALKNAPKIYPEKEMIDEILNIWKYFKSNDVKYITIGGFAVNIYGYNRNTGDLDILIEDSTENRKNLRKAFIEIGIGDFESIENMQFVPGWTDFTLDFGLRLDVMTSVKGLEDKTFEELLNQATIVMIGNVPVNFIDYNNLIVAKKASNRLKDQLDIEELNKLNSNDEA